MCILEKQQLLGRIFLAAVFLSCTSFTQAQAKSRVGREFREQVDLIARQALESTGVPSASIAIVKDGQIAYIQAYGHARLEPHIPARPEMRYSVGSISKQFTATAILMLAEEHKLSLDDPVSRFLPTLTRANEVKIRELLSHTSGYQDYWPQDYVPPFMLAEVTADQILEQWARKPLDFDPGTQWQYSNTNFVIAGLIVEKASGMPLLKFLRERVFTPIKMESVADVDGRPLGDTDATGYLRYGLGPDRVAPKEGKGWLYAAAELAMPAQDLAKWDLAMINQRLLKPSSYKEMQTEVLLKNGEGTRYGLGIAVRQELNHRALEHGGAVSGFAAQNVVFPDDRVAVIVLTNEMPADAASEIAHKIAGLLFSEDQVLDNKEKQRARRLFDQLQQGVVDRSLLTANANSYLTEQALQDFSTSLAPLGPPQEFVQTGKEQRGGMTFFSYKAKFSQRTFAVWVREMPDGKIEQYQLMVEP
jgi:CubicO group peptidase (beta-lactamase class C family)